MAVVKVANIRLVTAGRAWWSRSLGGRSWSRMRELDLDTHILAFSAQQVLCTAPMIVAISSVLQRVTGNDVSNSISRFFGLRDEAGRAVARLFGRSSGQISTSELVFGLVVAVLFTTSVAAVQQRAFEMIWTLPRRISTVGYIRQLLWVPALAVFISALLGVGRLVRAMDMTGSHGGPVLIVTLQAVVVFFFYWWTQRWLLQGRVEWRALVPGSALVAVATVITVRLSRLIMDGQITWQVEAYGLVGAVFVMSVWLGIFSAVIFSGILLGAVFVERRRELASLGARSPREEIEIHPLTVAGLEDEAAELERERTAVRHEATTVDGAR